VSCGLRHARDELPHDEGSLLRRRERAAVRFPNGMRSRRRRRRASLKVARSLASRRRFCLDFFSATHVPPRGPCVGSPTCFTCNPACRVPHREGGLAHRHQFEAEEDLRTRRSQPRCPVQDDDDVSGTSFGPGRRRRSLRSPRPPPASLLLLLLLEDTTNNVLRARAGRPVSASEIRSNSTHVGSNSIHVQRSKLSGTNRCVPGPGAHE
jgi:hypothetical protein